MRMLGDTIVVERGEKFSLDFTVTGHNGVPFTILDKWKNPYLVATVASARYKEKGDYRLNYWCNLKKKYVEDIDGNYLEENIKSFTSNTPIEVEQFDVNWILQQYGKGTGNGRLVINAESEFDVRKFLYTSYVNNKKVFKCIKDFGINSAAVLHDADMTTVSFVDYTRYYNYGDLVDYQSGLYVCTRDNVLGDTIHYPGASNYPWALVRRSAQGYNPLTKTDGKWKVDYDVSSDILNGDYKNGVICLTVNEFSDGTIQKIPSIYIPEKETRELHWYPLAPELYDLDGYVFSNTIWEEYDFRAVIPFDSKDWVEQDYIYELKIVSGQSMNEYITEQLKVLGVSKIDDIVDETIRRGLEELQNSNAPLAPSYESNVIIVESAKIKVSSDLQIGR